MASNIIDSYLISLGWSVDAATKKLYQDAVNSTRKLVSDATRSVSSDFGKWQKASSGAIAQARKDSQGFGQQVHENVKQLEEWFGAAASGLTKVGGTVVAVNTGILGFFAGVTSGVLGLADSVAQSDLEFGLLGNRMMMRSDDAKRLSISLSSLGHSLDEVAWSPELQERFSKLQEDQKQLQSQLGESFKGQMRSIRDLSFEVTRLKVSFQYLGMQLVVALFNRLGLSIEEVHQKLQGWAAYFIASIPKIADWLSDTLLPVLQDTWDMIKGAWQELKEFGIAFINLSAVLSGDDSIQTTTFSFEKLGKALKDDAGFLKDIFDLTKNTLEALNHLGNGIDFLFTGKFKDAAKEIREALKADSQMAVIDWNKGPFGGMKRQGDAAKEATDNPIQRDTATYFGDSRKAAEAAWKQAQRVGSMTGADPSLVFEQWAHETGGFASDVFKRTLNMAGIKQGKDYQQFGNLDAFGDRYAQLLKGKWGKTGVLNAKSIQDFATDLKTKYWYEDTTKKDGSPDPEGRQKSIQIYVNGMQSWAKKYKDLIGQTVDSSGLTGFTKQNQDLASQTMARNYFSGDQSGKSMTVTQSTSIGDIHVTVTQPGATPDQIAKVVRDTVRTETQKKQQRDLAQLQAAY